MRKLALCAWVCLTVPTTLSAQDLPRSTAFPGSAWVAIGNVGPAEPDNLLGMASFEQGVTAWESGPWFLVPFVGASMGTDSAGYAWNNRHPVQLSVKLVRRVRGGVLQAGGGVLFEHDPATGQQTHGTVFANYWSGWTADRHTHRGGTFIGFPGHAYASSGLTSGRDPQNWLTALTAQQGVLIFKSQVVSVVPYGAAGLTFDSRRRTWENRLTYDAGIKIVRPLIGGVVEAGVAGRRQHELLTGRVDSGPVAYVNLWVGWNPRSVYR